MAHPVTRPAEAPLSPYGWWHGAVLYQVYPRSFLDSNGDGVGDLNGIIKGLDHIASLGVDGVWLSPFFTSPMNDFGYDIADYCDVDPLFGTLDDFDRLVNKAHSLGLKVIIDQVYSHTSDQHAWFKESRSSRHNPKADWYVWADPKADGSPPSNWQSVFGGPSWEWDNHRGQYYLHNFLTSQPDLNVHNPAVQEALLNVARFWLDRGVDGFRLDALNFAMHDPALRDNPPAGDTGKPKTRPFDFQAHTRSQSHPDIPLFIEKISAVLKEYDGIFTVAEVGGPTPMAEMKAFTKGEKRLNSAYDFSFLYAETLTASAVRSAIADWTQAPEDGWPSWAFSNHDAPRAVSRWAGSGYRDQAARLHLMLLMCLRGNPFIFQGDELGLPAANVPFDCLKDPEAIANWPHTLGRDSSRTPIPWRNIEGGGFSPPLSQQPWLPVDPDHLPLSIQSQNEDVDSLLAYTRSLIALRQQSPALKWGDITCLENANLSDDSSLLIFTRFFEGDRTVCVFNLDTENSENIAGLGLTGAVLEVVGLDGTAGIPSKLPPLSGFILQQS